MSCASAIPSVTLFEKGMYIGINLQDILYGIELVLYIKAMKIFVARRKEPHKSDTFSAVFSTVMLALITIWVAALSTLGERMWLLDRNYPGGPMAYHTAKSSDLYMLLGRFSLTCLQQMADALMIYRCWVMWASRRVVILPSILWVLNCGLGSMLIRACSMPGTTFFSGLVPKLALAYYSSSTFLNVSLTGMLCYRLLAHAGIVKDHLGEKYASPYLAIVAIVVESALPFTLSSVVFLITYGMGSQSLVVFSFVHPLVMCVSPQMLILRMAEAEAWQGEECVLPASVPPVNADMSSPGRFRGNFIVAHPQASSNMRSSRQQSSGGVMIRRE